jgi:photosystem II stability/assembly factor-like uncharacterized protein
MRNYTWLLVSIALLLPIATCGLLSAQHTTTAPWQLQTSNTTAGLRGIHAVSGSIAWASGTNGTVLRTTDSGQHWQHCAIPPDAQKLDFRGIWAWDANTAIVMSSGPGALSRLYKTTDACTHWKLLFTNPDKSGFWDAMTFQNSALGFLLGDPVQGRFVVLTTTNGGSTWSRSKASGLEANNGATGAFAASNTSLLAGLREPLLFGTGGGFVYAAQTLGSINFSMKPGTHIKMHEQWIRVSTPLTAPGDSSGIFSLDYHAGPVTGYGYTLVAVGGDYTKPNDPAGTAAWSPDGGQHWTAAKTPPHGYRSAVAWDPSAKAWIAAGTNGSDISYDDGKTWLPLDNGNWNALSLPWVVGPDGRVARLNPDGLPRH